MTELKKTFILQFLTGFVSELKMARRLSNTHHARWMGSCLYILKMVVCGGWFFLSAQQQEDVLQLAQYIVHVHFLYWFSCTKLCDAPVLTLQLHRDLTAWASRDEQATKAAVRKLDLHLDYVNARNVTMALASSLLDSDSKAKLAATILEHDPRDETGNYPQFPLGKPAMPRIYDDSTLPDFVSEESWIFFDVRLLRYG